MRCVQGRTATGAPACCAAHHAAVPHADTSLDNTPSRPANHNKVECTLVHRLLVCCETGLCNRRSSAPPLLDPLESPEECAGLFLGFKLWIAPALNTPAVNILASGSSRAPHTISCLSPCPGLSSPLRPVLRPHLTCSSSLAHPPRFPSLFRSCMGHGPCHGQRQRCPSRAIQPPA